MSRFRILVVSVALLVMLAGIEAPASPGVVGDLVNGDFEDGLNGWTTEGPVQWVGSDDHVAYLTENPSGPVTMLYQNFDVPTNANTLSFWYLMLRIAGDPGNHTPEAFEFWLLDPDTLQPLLPTVSFSDASFWADIDGGMEHAPEIVTVSDPDADGGRIVTVDLSSLPGGSRAQVRFGLSDVVDADSVVAAVNDVVVSAQIPAASTWGLLIMAALIFSVATVLIRRRSRAAV